MTDECIKPSTDDGNHRAAQYVRMSTEHQKYSTENQSEAITRYASARGLNIVRSYADEGKSGLKLDGREALQSLIADVEAGLADYANILVYDVSRWGRFQNADEAAYLEHICTRAGIAVHYCAEQFENDGSIAATIIKSMKRAMAGEYSRELSAKVFAGQCRLIKLGFRQGGMAGYGLRRMLVDEHRTPKVPLRLGEQKSLQTDRVILVPGPEDEILTVRRIYCLFVEHGLSESQLADLLNREGVTTDLGRPWTRATVHQVLTNEKYIGNNVFNRVSFKLKKCRVRNPPDLLVRATEVFEPLVSSQLFEMAAAIIALRSRKYTDEELLEMLAALRAEKGQLSALIIDEQDSFPSTSAYRARFGSLLRAYQLIGYEPRRDYRYIEINRFLRGLHDDRVRATIDAIVKTGAEVVRDMSTDILSINGELTASIVVARCLVTRGGRLRWKIRFDTGLQPDITVALRMAADNRQVLDYYLLPRLDFPAGRLRLAEENEFSIDAYRVDTLQPFFDLTARSSIRRAA